MPRRARRALHDAVLALAAPPQAGGIVPLLGRITALAAEAVGGRDGRLVLAEDPAWSDLLPAADPASGPITLDHAGRLTRRPLRPGGATHFAFTHGRPAVVRDTTRRSRFGTYPQLSGPGIRSFAILPLRDSGRLLGVIGVTFDEPLHPTRGELHTLEQFAAHAAAALGRAALAAAAEHQTLALARREAEAAALQRLDDLKKEFFSTLSHELRTPLTVLTGYAQRLRSGAGAMARDEDRLRQVAERMYAAVDQLRRLVDDMLDFARIERGQVALTVQSFDLVPLLRDVAADFQGQPGGERVRVRLPRSAMTSADPVRTRQAVSNLLSNALKYAPSDDIWLRASRRPGAVRVEVQDRGPGIPADEVDHIWQRFFRSTATGDDSVVQGTGLGLAVVKTLVEAQGGRVGVSSTWGEGATFWLELPAAAAAPSAA